MKEVMVAIRVVEEGVGSSSEGVGEGASVI